MPVERSGWQRAIAFADRVRDRLTELDAQSPSDGESLLSQRTVFTSAADVGQRSMGGKCRLFEVADGWCAVHLPRVDDLELLPAWLGVEVDSVEEAWGPVESLLRNRRSRDVVESGQELGLAVAMVPVGDDQQLRERQTMNAARPWIQRRIGTPSDVATMEGAVVVDFSSLWAGPLCARVLADAGAHVIKVESTTRPDASRDGDSALFEWLHRGHEFRSLAFDSDAGLAELRDLISKADVVIEASRPRAFDRLGIMPNEVLTSAVGKVWLSITAYGRCGPWSNWVGFGDDTAVAGGLVDTDEDGRPCFVGDAVADPLTGLLASALVINACRRGGGVTIDVSLREVARSAAHSAQLVW
jgi:hypothetical protein